MCSLHLVYWTVARCTQVIAFKQPGPRDAILTSTTGPPEAQHVVRQTSAIPSATPIPCTTEHPLPCEMCTH